MVTTAAYHLLWLCGGLAAIAAASAGLLWRRRWRTVRRSRAVDLLDALGRSGEWIAAQRLALCFQGRIEPEDPARADIRALQERWFPELAASGRLLGSVQARLAQVLEANDRLRRADPEEWLGSGSDDAFVALAREHAAALRDLEHRLAAALAGGTAFLPQFTFR